jgi:hypothetical protein
VEFEARNVEAMWFRQDRENSLRPGYGDIRIIIFSKFQWLKYQAFWRIKAENEIAPKRQGEVADGRRPTMR